VFSAGDLEEQFWAGAETAVSLTFYKRERKDGNLHPSAARKSVTIDTVADGKLVSLQTLQERKATHRRWPVPYVIAFTIVVSAALWAIIIVAGSWLI
jgi:hypothetical protein